MKHRVNRYLVALTAALLSGFVLTTPALAAPPANDNFANAQTIGPALPVNVPATNVEATAEVGEPAIFGNAVSSSIWFRWTAPANGLTVVDLCGNGFTGDEYPFEKFAVKTGNVLNSLATVVEMAGECRTRFNAVSGQQYKIQVDYGTDQGTFSFKLRQLAPPPNDNFASSTVVGPALPVTLNGTNSDSTYEAGEPPSFGGSGSSRSVWYSWTSPSTGRVRLEICETTGIVGPQNRVIGIYTGNSLAGLVVVSSSSNCQIDFSAIAGTTYRIGFSGNIVGEMNFVLKLENAPPPGNDNIANATAVGPALPIQLAGDNDFATAEAGEPSHSGVGNAEHSLWYSWTPAQNTRVRISACSKSFSGARVGVYTGIPGALVQAAELPNYAPHCGVVLNGVAGTKYWIAAAGGIQEYNHGPFTLDIHAEKIPPNDNFANAQEIGSTLPANLTGTTVDATVEDNEPSHSTYGGDYTPSVWYRWTAPNDDAMIFSACSTGEPVRLAVYSGAALIDLEQIDSADTGCAAGTTGGRLAIAPVAGATYSIAVAAQEEDFPADFAFTAKGPTSTVIVTPPKPTFNLKKAIAKCKKIKSKKKRTNCIKAAKKKAAIIKCKKLKGKSVQNKCIAKARKRFK